MLARLELLPRSAVSTLVKPGQLLSLRDGVARVGVPSPLARDLLASKTEVLFRQAFAAVGKPVARVAFEVVAEEILLGELLWRVQSPPGLVAGCHYFTE